MLETIGNNEVYVKNYTSNFDIKDYINNVMIPETYPDVPMNKLNLGLVGLVSEYLSGAIEDSYGTASLMMNESFVTKATLPKSIYSAASLFDLGYTFATPSKCNVAVLVWIEDILEYSSKVHSTNYSRCYIDKDTKIIMGNNIYKFDYDIIIDSQMLSGQTVYTTYYDMSENNPISDINNKFIQHRVAANGWLVLITSVKEFERKVTEHTVSDNLVTSNSDIVVMWSGQIAGVDLVYITPKGERIPMKIKNQYTSCEHTPFVWYTFDNDQQISLMFSADKGYWQPDFNSKIEVTIFTTNGESANFDEYNPTTGIPVVKTSTNYSYNSSIKMSALCYGSSVGGLDKGDIELLRTNTVLSYNTANVVTTDNDLKLWFDMYGQRYNSRCEVFKRRDDPSGKLFSQFIAITNDSYIYPTNTLNIVVSHEQFDFINDDVDGINNEFILQPGHLWEYVDDSRTTVKMVLGENNTPAMLRDQTLPSINSDREFMFTNPFYMKIKRYPGVTTNYNYMINDTSFPETIAIDSDTFYDFQMATLSITRTIDMDHYNIQVICVPVVTDNSTMSYITNYGEDADVHENSLRVVLVTRSSEHGETGYIEMYPTENRASGSFVFETKLYVDDNLNSAMQLDIDYSKNKITSLITTGELTGTSVIDALETSFHFITLIKDFENNAATGLFDDDRYRDYVITNRFNNANRDVNLYTPMTMMRSAITFTGSNNNYTVNASLVSFLKYDIALDNDKMTYFTNAFVAQYNAMEPVLSKLDGNSYIDYKLFNTYGRSNNYYIGPEDGVENLWDSSLLIDSVYVQIKFRLAVHDRSLYTQTADAVIIDVQQFFESLDAGTVVDVHVSDLIHIIVENNPNVNYVRFLGFNNYDANKQSIFIKYDNLDMLSEVDLRNYVPEIIHADALSIDITEEV